MLPSPFLSSAPRRTCDRAGAPGRCSAAWLAWLAALLFAPAAAGADDAFRILYHEPLRELRVDASGRALGFEAYGRRFELRLERNESLRFVTPERMPGVEALRGTLAGVEGSWLRLTRTPSGLYGLIFDGRDYYAVEPAAEAEGEVVGPLAARGTAPVIYRLADTLVPAGAASCGTVRHIHELGAAEAPPVTAQQVLEGLGGSFGLQAATLPTRQLQATVVGDYELSQLPNFVGANGTAEQAIAVRMNVVDGIFAAQLGVKVVVAEARVFRDPNDPFTSTTSSSTLLGELASWRQSTPGQSARGLTHLITGRELDGSTVGVAYVGGLCSPRFSAGLSQGNLSATNSALVIAHEMGHNFGASHDGEAGSPCESTASTFLMAARLNGSQTFSQCSIDSIRPRIAAAPTSCLAVITVPDADIDAPAPARRLRGVAFDYTFNVRSIGALAIDGVTATVTLPAALTLNSSQVAGGGSCTAGSGGTLSCTLGSIPVQTSRAVTLNLRASQSGTAAVSILVAAPADAVSANNSAQVAFGIDPSADLSVTLTAAPAAFTTAGSSQVTARVRHLEGDPAADVRLSFELPAGLNVSGIATNNLGCTLAAGTVSCAPRGLAAGASEDVVLTVASPQTGTRSIKATVAATVGDPVAGNNAAEAALEVSAPPPSGGGGGSLGAGLLLLLSLALGLRAAGRR